MLAYLSSVLTNKCPRCRKGYLFQTKNAYDFKKMNKMHDTCTVCGQPTEIEVGFYYGTGYVSYALTVAFSVATFIAWKVLIGISFNINDNQIFYWFISNAVLMILLQPIFIRLSRSLWLSWFVTFDKNWHTKQPPKQERIIEEMKEF